MTTRIGRTVLLSRDLAATAAFYADGFGFATLHDETADGVRLLHVGPEGPHGPGLWLLPVADGVPTTRPGNAPDLVLYVDDLDTTLRHLAAAGVEPHVPAQTDDASGDRYAHVRDPDGNLVIAVQLAAQPAVQLAAEDAAGG
ncbi:VOC family protein [Oerskovia flava]|uniref:VOC family protein n=1 Tax=Oerskovia flava TaxID=2986422 RepID=UPI00223EE6D9|nr:VOC family protein [Oerskovia sp. JB1-3-2]